MDEDALNKLLNELVNSITSVDDAIKDKEEENKLLKESFNNVKNLYKDVSNVRKMIIDQLNLSKFKLQLVKLYSILINSGYIDILNLELNKINETNYEFKSQKNLLIAIKDSIKKLEKYNTGVCNYDISVLLWLIYDKDFKVIEILNDYLKTCEYAMNGITYYGNKRLDDDLEEINNQINTHTLKLGINNKKELGGVISDDIK